MSTARVELVKVGADDSAGRADGLPLPPNHLQLHLRVYHTGFIGLLAVKRVDHDSCIILTGCGFDNASAESPAAQFVLSWPGVTAPEELTPVDLATRAGHDRLVLSHGLHIGLRDMLVDAPRTFVWVKYDDHEVSCLHLFVLQLTERQLREIKLTKIV
mmetsp:Transcript_73774/g.123234  ORF Transcript_73774/g.123234 Transcript_73774/m.123234 type:complete len:158 (-) Transcript_73774:274-747(-)